MKVPLVTLMIPLLLATSASARATAASPGAAFVLARLVSVEDVTPPTHAITVDGTYRLTFRPEKVLVGRDAEEQVTETVTSARPVPGVDYYLLVDKVNGQLRVSWSSVSANGICMDVGTADRYGLWSSIRDLERQYPCKQK
jgi:hypothetical protein